MPSDIGGRLWSGFWRFWYPYVTTLMNDGELKFMNYGYLHPDLNPATLKLDVEDEPDRFFIQLYHQTASFMDLADKDVLEVSSGHGGGAAYVAKYLNPNKMVGLERNHKAVRLARQTNQLENLTFVVGDAMALDMPDASFDVVLNVEASHSYADVTQFYKEVARVLKPGGYFLTTDFRPTGQLDHWRNELVSSGLVIEKEQNITSNVLQAMTIISEDRHAMIDSRTPFWIRWFFRSFAGVQGSNIFEGFQSGSRTYMTFALRKPNQ